MGTAVICGNLPVLGPLFKTVFKMLGSSSVATTKKSGTYDLSRSRPRPTYNDATESNASGKHHFERLSDTESQPEHPGASDIELEQRGIKA